MLKRVVAIFAGAGHKPTFVTWLKSNPPKLGPWTPLQAPVRCITLVAAKLTTLFPMLDGDTYNDARIVAPGYDVHYLEQSGEDIGWRVVASP